MSSPIRMEVTKFKDNKGKQREYLNRIEAIVDGVAEKMAGRVADKAKRLVPKDTRTLMSEIRVETGKFASGDYYIRAQGPGNYSRYYASFVELGTRVFPYGNRNLPKVHRPAKPYLRPAIKGMRRNIERAAKEAVSR